MDPLLQQQPKFYGKHEQYEDFETNFENWCVMCRIPEQDTGRRVMASLQGELKSHLMSMMKGHQYDWAIIKEYLRRRYRFPTQAEAL